MRRIIMFALVALTAFGGVAAADRGGRGPGPVFRDHRSGGVTVQPIRPRYQGRYYYHQPSVRVVRRPIYVQRPVIRYRYYNYYRRPAVIVESYPPVAGYYWVPGQWYWNGYEWLWQPGHYEPDPQYRVPYPQYQVPYPSSYDGSYPYPSSYDDNYNGY